MNIMWFGFAFIALLCFSGSDLFCKIGSSPDDSYSHMKMIFTVGMVMGIHAALRITLGGTTITFTDIEIYLPVALISVVTMLIGFCGLRYIELSISSPICNSSGVLAALFSYLFLGQSINKMQLFAVILICFSVIQLGIIEVREDAEHRAKRQKDSKIKYPKTAIGIAISFSYCFTNTCATIADTIALERISERSASAIYELTLFAAGIVAFIYVVIYKKQKLKAAWELPKVIGAVFETGGQFAYMFALSRNAILAAPLISAYCVGSVVWSRLFLKEKLNAKHYFLVALCIFGMVVMAAVSI